MKIIKNKLLTKALVLLMFIGTNNALAEFGTLFTTASERKTIDDNRYVIKKTKKVTTVAVARIEVEEVKKIVYKIIKKEYKISGISIAHNGVDSAWINGKSYEDGDVLNNKVTVTISASKRNVRFTVRGGKSFFGQSGDKVIVSYRVPLLD